MIKPLLCFSLCVYGALSVPIQTFEVLDDPENDAEIIDAAEPLPGINNLLEKRIPVIRLLVPGSYMDLYGTKNMGERVQVPHRYDSLPGLVNLEEKSIPESVISRLSMSRDPKSEVEKINVDVYSQE